MRSVIHVSKGQVAERIERPLEHQSIFLLVEASKACRPVEGGDPAEMAP